MKQIILQYSLHIFCGLCLLFLFECKDKTIMENDEPAPTDSIAVLLDVKVINNKEVIVEPTFCNKLDVMVGIEKSDILYGNRMNWVAFKVMRGKKEIPYIGLREYILDESVNKEDLYNLMPGGSYTARTELNNEYDLSHSGTYTVTYEGFRWLPDEKGNDDLFFVRSNTVEFKLKKGIQPVPPISERRF